MFLIFAYEVDGVDIGNADPICFLLRWVIDGNLSAGAPLSVSIRFSMPIPILILIAVLPTLPVAMLIRMEMLSITLPTRP